MGIELFWDDDNETVFLIEVRGKWAWSELSSTMKSIKRISDERGKVLGAILDLGNGLQLPEGGIFSQQGLAQFQELLKLDGGKRGPMAIVGMNPLVRQIFDAVNGLDAKAVRMVRFADTMQQAQQWVYGTMQKVAI
jgi:hypothetical protein